MGKLYLELVGSRNGTYWQNPWVGLFIFPMLKIDVWQLLSHRNNLRIVETNTGAANQNC